MSMNDSSPPEVDPVLVGRSTIARAIVTKRQAKKWSQRELAQMAGVGVGTVSSGERGGQIARATVLKLARVLGCVDELKAVLDAMEVAS
jgi:transcriptional regulator with XRE-family HTH domain